MRSLYATRFFIDDVPFPEVHDRIQDWVRTSVKRQRAALSYVSDGDERTTPQGHRLRALEQEIADGRVLEVEWEHPHKDDPDLLWNTRLTLAADGEKVEFGCLLRIGSRSFKIAPLGSISAGAPGIVGELLREHTCHASQAEIAAKHTRILRNEVDRILVPFLLSSDRALPIVLVSQDNETGDSLADPRRVQDRLSGLAHVYEITGEAGFELTDALGKKSSCFNGAVRVYWPGFEPAAWRQHPLYLPDRIRAVQARGRRVQDELFRLLSEIAASRFDDGELWRSLRAQANRQRQETIRRRLSEPPASAPPEDLTEFYEDYERTLEKVEQLDVHNAALAKETARLRAENAGLQANLSTLTQYASADEADMESGSVDAEPATVSDALGQAAARYEGLSVWESATASAADSVSNRAGRVRDALRSIAKLSGLYFATPERSIGESFKSFFDKQGIKYAAKETDMTMQQHGAERTFRDGGRSREIQQHVTLGQGTRADCVQIYFDADEETGTFVIGYCGVHLDTARGSF